MNRPLYGLGYEPIGDLLDFVPPVAVARAVGRKIDRYVDRKAGQAAAMAEQRVEGA
jgi:hypothetical protein